MTDPQDPLSLVAPLVRVDGNEFDRWLGDSLARTLSSRLEASGRRVVSVDSAARLCKSLGIELSSASDPADVELLCAQTGATHIIFGSFERDDGDLELELRVLSPGSPPGSADARGPERDFQEVVDDAIVRLIRSVPGAKGEHVRGALRAARTTESLDAYLAVVRARAAWDRGDVQAFEDEVAAAIRLDTGYVDPHQVVAVAARDLGDISREVESLREVARVHGDAGRGHEEATALLFVGHALVEAGDWDAGVEAYTDAASLFDGLKEVRGSVQARMNIANVLLRRGDHDQAIAEYVSGLERVKGFPADQAKYLFNLGLALKETGKLDDAVVRLEEARALGMELRDDELIASAYNALGTVFDDKKDLDGALRHFRRAEEHLDAEADPVLLAGVKDHIGIILKKQYKQEEALKYSEQACQLFESRGDPLHVAIAYVNRAGLLIELGREEEALPFVVSAHREFARLGSPSQEKTERILRDQGFDDDSIEAIVLDGEDDEDDDDLDELDYEDEDDWEDDGGDEDEDEEGLDELEEDLE